MSLSKIAFKIDYKASGMTDYLLRTLESQSETVMFIRSLSVRVTTYEKHQKYTLADS